jgi:hypothetical protein
MTLNAKLYPTESDPHVLVIKCSYECNAHILNSPSCAKLQEKASEAIDAVSDWYYEKTEGI